MRFIHLIVVAALVAAAVDVYKIKFEFDRPGGAGRETPRRDQT